MLRTWPLRESDLIVTIYTHAHGKVRGVARGARKPMGRWSGALEPMTEVELQWTVKEGQELLTLTDVSIERSPYHPMPDLGVTWTLAFLAELLDATAAAHDADEVLYRLAGTCVDALLAGATPTLVARYAQAWVLHLHGVLPDLDECVACGRSLVEHGGSWKWSLHGVACADCAGAHARSAGSRGDGEGPTLLPEDVAFLAQVRGRKPADVVAPGALALRRTGVFLGRLLAEMLGRELRSERFLDELER